MTWASIAVGAGTALVGGVSSKNAADQQGGAADAAGRMAQRGLYANLATQEPGRLAGYNALSTIGGMYGWTPAPYTTAQDLAATQTPMTAKQVKGLLRQGMTYDQIHQQGRLTQINPKTIKRLRAAGLSPEQIQGLAAGNTASSAQPSVGPTATQPVPAGAAGAPGAPGADGGDPRFAAFFNSPDFQLRYQRAMEGVERSAASRTGALNPATLQAAGATAGEMQGAEYGNWFNRLMQIAQGGEAANNNAAGAGSQYTGQASNAVQGAADARASGVMGIGNSVMSGVNTGINAYLMNKYMNRPPAAPAPGGTPPYVPPPAPGYSPYGPYAGGYQPPPRPWGT